MSGKNTGEDKQKRTRKGESKRFGDNMVENLKRRIVKINRVWFLQGLHTKRKLVLVTEIISLLNSHKK